MKDEKMDNFFSTNSGKLPVDKVGYIRDRMRTLDDSRFPVISSVELKNPTIMLIISIFLGAFGIDRFMLGKVGSGIAKLVLGWLTLGLWWLIDVCSICKMTKEYNYNKLCEVL